jgi:predicted dehydrogenase
MLGYFSYFNDDPQNIRSVAEWGGGALMDIGCYLIYTGRMIFGRAPARVAGIIERDVPLEVDTLTSLMLDFAPGHLVGTCSTQAAPYQRVHIVGTTGRIEIQIPFNAPADKPCTILIDDGEIHGNGIDEVHVEICNQYTIQG